MDQLQTYLRSEIYKGRLLAPETPRRGDEAAIVKDCDNELTGQIVKVVGDPHRCTCYCTSCGFHHQHWFVEIECDDWDASLGPFFHPIKWLRRVLPLSLAGMRQ
jgi:hypothetical protein